MFTKTPVDITVKAGSTARLECAASGQPTPVIAWQKDGGDDFPAAQERRMRVLPKDDVFFIVKVTSADMGTYSCTANNAAGMIIHNATLTVLGKSTSCLIHIHYFLNIKIVDCILNLSAHIVLVIHIVRVSVVSMASELVSCYLSYIECLPY